MKCCKHKIGELKHWITLKSRDIKGATAGVGFTEEFTNKPIQVQAKIKTLNGKIVFDGTGTERIATHLFVIRFSDSLTNEDWIEFKSKNYNIIDFTNVDEEDEWLEFNCEERGLSAYVVNHA
jgi:SPP1 family predicted phage head-tail adaptor